MAEAIKNLTNGQLYDEWNESCWARLRGETIGSERQTRLDAIEAELSARPTEDLATPHPDTAVSP